MLGDRSYMRDPYSRHPMFHSAAIVLLFANIAAFVVQMILYRFTSFDIDRYLALSLPGLKHGFVWQFLTFQFLHAGVFHLLGNALVLYFFGKALEEDLGRGRFLFLYFGSGLAGGFLQAVGMAFLPDFFGGGYVMGASGGAFGLVAAYAMLWPDRVLTLLLFFILPVHIKARYLLIGATALAVYGLIMGGDGVAHGAHLGGIAFGIAFVYWGVRQYGFERMASMFERRSPPKKKLPESPQSATSEDVDAILDKISAHGIHSLTERERRILEQARSRMAKK